jgi:hypothetical protein
VIPTNNAPTRTSKALPDVTGPQVFNLAELFQDVDGDSLTYEIIVSNSSVVNTTVVDGTYLHVTRGFEESEQSVIKSGTVTIIARDSSAQTSDTFTVTFAFVPQIAVETLAFHHGVFNASDYGGTHSDVGSAALAGLVYADTPMGDYAWGTLGAMISVTEALPAVVQTIAVDPTCDVVTCTWHSYGSTITHRKTVEKVVGDAAGGYRYVYSFSGLASEVQYDFAYDTVTKSWIDYGSYPSKQSVVEDSTSPGTVTFHVKSSLNIKLFRFENPYYVSPSYQWEPKISLKADVLMVAGGGLCSPLTIMSITLPAHVFEEASGVSTQKKSEEEEIKRRRR